MAIRNDDDFLRSLGMEPPTDANSQAKNMVTMNGQPGMVVQGNSQPPGAQPFSPYKSGMDQAAAQKTLKERAQAALKGKKASPALGKLKAKLKPATEPVPPPPGPEAAAPGTSGITANQVRVTPGVTPGASSKDERSEQVTTDVKDTANRYLTPEQMAEQETMANQTPGVIDQKRGLEQMSQLARIYADQPTRPSLQSLYNLGSVMSDGKYNFVDKPREENPMGKRLLEHYQKMQDDRRDVTKSAVEYQKALKSGTHTEGTGTKNELAITLGVATPKPDTGRHGGGQTDQEIRWADALQGKMKTDKQLVGVNERTLALTSAQNLLKEGKSVADEAFKIAFTRAMGDTHISNLDVATKTGDKAALDRLEQAFETISSGKFTETNRKEYLDMLESLNRYLATAKNQRLNYWQTQGTNTYKFSPKKAAEVVRGGQEEGFGIGEWTPPPRGQAAAAAPAAPSADGKIEVYDQAGKLAGRIRNTPGQIQAAAAQGLAPRGK